MIVIDLNYYKDNNKILDDVLKKVNEDKIIHNNKNMYSKLCNFGNDAITGEAILCEYEATNDTKLADMIIEDMIYYYKRDVNIITNVTFKYWFNFYFKNMNYTNNQYISNK